MANSSRRSWLRLFGWLILLGFQTGFVLPQRAAAESLSVQPGQLLISDIPIGRRLSFYEEYKLPFTIFNKGDKPQTYVLQPIASSLLGKGTWAEGYTELPDPKWLSFEPARVVVPAQGQAEARMYLSIPQDERYLNQHWVISVDVHSVPEPGSILSLAVYPRFYIETVSKADATVAPVGQLGVMPAMLQVETAQRGKIAVGKVQVFNNDKETHVYRVTSQTDAGPHQSTTGYAWLPETSRVQVEPAELKLGPGQKGEITVTAQLAVDDATLTGRREALVFVRNESGHAAFVRVLLNIIGGN